MSPSAAWRAATQSRCSECGELLGFLEGPHCDGCVERNAHRPGLLAWCYRRLREREVTRYDSLLSEGETTDGARWDAKDSLSVDLTTGEVTVFPSHRPVTVSERRRS